MTRGFIGVNLATRRDVELIGFILRFADVSVSSTRLQTKPAQTRNFNVIHLACISGGGMVRNQQRHMRSMCDTHVAWIRCTVYIPFHSKNHCERAKAEVRLERVINLPSTTKATENVPNYGSFLHLTTIKIIWRLIFSVTLQSFNDLERGISPQGVSGPSARTGQSPKDTQFLNLQSSLGLQAFKINTNVKGILKFVDQLGTPRDTGIVRKGL